MNERYHPKVINEAQVCYDKCVKILSSLKRETKSEYLFDFVSSVSALYLSIGANETQSFEACISSIKKYRCEFTDIKSDVKNDLELIWVESILKTLGVILQKIAKDIPVSEDEIEQCRSKMLYNLNHRVSKKTIVVINEDIVEEVMIEARQYGAHQIEREMKNLALWRNEIEIEGIVAVQKNPKWKDHPLTRDAMWLGHRSASLSYGGRVIYQVAEEVVSNQIQKKVIVKRITVTHNYKVDDF